MTSKVIAELEQRLKTAEEEAVLALANVEAATVAAKQAEADADELRAVLKKLRPKREEPEAVAEPAAEEKPA